MSRRCGLLGIVFAAAALALAGCSSDGGSETPDVPGTGADSPAVDDGVLPACPDEVDLTTVALPCDCYGNVATDPEAQVPGCKSQVVCCPSIGNLRCEDHEQDVPATGDEGSADVAQPDAVEDVPLPGDVPVADEPTPPADVAADLAADAPADVSYPKCPFEVDLAHKTPCTCKGTLVLDVEQAIPDCDKKVVCCPFKGVICE